MNIPELEKYLKLFYQISGMEIACLDSHYHQICACQGLYGHFCHMIHRYPKCMKLCCESDAQHLTQVTSSPGLITYTCPFGFYSAIAPICQEGTPVAYLFFSPGIEIRENCDLPPIEAVKALVPDINPRLLEDGIAKIPHNSREKLDAYAQLLLLIAHQIEQHGFATEKGEDVATLTKRYIDNNLQAKITLSNLSWKLHSSTVTLTEHFRHKYGMSIMTYVTKQRMALAAELLRNTRHSVGEIAFRCGFADVEYFSRTFKKHFGISPSKWRNMPET